MGPGWRERVEQAQAFLKRADSTAEVDALRAELKAANSPIQVACVSPGFVDTPLLDQYFRGREQTLNQTRAAMKMLDPSDVAHAVLTILEAPQHVEIGDILLRSSQQHM